MMSGLRSQRDRMITWVSLRSGVASSGRCITDQVPQRHAAATNAKIKYLLRTEKVMRRLIILPPRRRTCCVLVGENRHHRSGRHLKNECWDWNPNRHVVQ